MKDVDLGEPTSCLDHVYFGLYSTRMQNKQGYCRQLAEICSNRRFLLGHWKTYYSGKNDYLPVFCFEGLINEFVEITCRFPSLRASFSSQVKNV